MTSRVALEAAVERHMDRRIIRVDSLPDHAGIAAALRRAFATAPNGEDLRPFEDLLKRLH
jgi:hypothetical protein